MRRGDGDAALDLAKLHLRHEPVRGRVEARRLLARAVASEYVTRASVEEAEALLREIAKLSNEDA